MFDWSHGDVLLAITLAAIVGLVVMIAWLKVQPFLALTLASLAVGLAAGVEPLEVVGAFQSGLGSVIAGVAMVISLGAIIGKLLEYSGGATQIAGTLVRWFGPRRLPWAVAAIGLLIGLPVFFQVGLVLLVPIVVMLARETRTSLARLGLPLVAGLSIAHGLVPPHPGPMAAVGLLKADLGETIFYSLLVAVPTLLVIAPLSAWLAGRIEPRAPAVDPAALPSPTVNAVAENRLLPGFGLSLLTILLPLGLMLAGTGAQIALRQQWPGPETSFDLQRVWRVLQFIGDPVIAMLAATLLAIFMLGLGRGLSRQRLLTLCDECLLPLAAVFLVIGAGGGFKEVLVRAGVADVIQQRAADAHLHPLLLAWTLAALLRVATGSATVAITTAAGVMAPIVAISPEVSRAWVVIALGAGSLVLSHFNDGGFWLVKEYLGLTSVQTLKTWTVIETAISLVALGLVLLFSRWV